MSEEPINPVSKEPAKPASPVRRTAEPTRQKAAAAKDAVARLAKDPVLRDKARRLWTTAQKLYDVAASPEAKKLYREAREILRDNWKR